MASIHDTPPAGRDADLVTVTSGKVSKRLRYEVLRRDNHTCRYCGGVPPDVRLTVDHVIPIALGGPDDPSNLVAACADCNSGKSSVPPDAAVVDDVRQDALRWAAAMRHAETIQTTQREQRCEFTDDCRAAWDNWTYATPNGERETVRPPINWRQTFEQFLEAGLDVDTVTEAIRIAMERTYVTFDGKWVYMCGIAWKTIKQRQQIARDLLAVEDADGT